MLFGGPVLFLAARAWYQRLVLDAAPRLQLLSIALLTAVAGASRAVPAFATGLRVLIVAGTVREEKGHELRIIRGEEIQHVLEMTGLDRVLPFTSR
jgi:low temperature requirement protein LtrA